MPLTLTGIDEAGYGPLLGPMALVGVSAEADDLDTLCRCCAAQPLGVADSKKVHTPGRLAPLESIALAAITWACGEQPTSAADCFALLGENATQRQLPWMDDADKLQLPVAARDIARWKIDGVRACGLTGQLVNPEAFHHDHGNGGNRHRLELQRVGEILRALPPSNGDRCITIDRLGGRRYYADYLAEVWQDSSVEVLREEAGCSSYALRQGHRRHQVRFLVDGESGSPLVAMASCIAKYARELHMLLLNRYWSGRQPGLRPTAGYHVDAQRWLRELGPATERYHRQLVRPTSG